MNHCFMDRLRMRKMLFLLLFAYSSLYAQEPRKTQETLPQRETTASLQEILNRFEEKSPGFIKTLSAEDLKRAEDAYLKALGKGIRIAQKEKPEILNPSDKEKLLRQHRASFEADGRFAVMKFDFLSEKSVSVMALSIVDQKKKPLGAILDLRTCSGGTPGGVVSARNFLKKMFSPRLPVMILISAKTTGPGEILAHLLVKERAGLSIGKKTAGKPYGIVRIEYTSRVWELPSPPEEWKHIPRVPVEPGIVCSSVPARKKGEKIVRDEAMRRALELLTSLDAVIPAKEKTKGAVR